MSKKEEPKKELTAEEQKEIMKEIEGELMPEKQEAQEEQTPNIADMTIADLFRAAKYAQAGCLTFVLNTTDKNLPDKAIIVLDGEKEAAQIIGLVEQEVAKWDYNVSTKDKGKEVK